MLEAACYAFAEQRLAHHLEASNWDCAEAVELSKWTAYFVTNQDVFTEDVHVKDALDLPTIFQSICNIRNTAVHRNRVNIHKILEFLTNAERLAALLENKPLMDMLHGMRGELEGHIDRG